MDEKRFKKRDNYKPLSSEDPVKGTVFMDQVLNKFHIDLNDPKGQLMIHWRTVVGEDLAEHVKFDRIDKGVLYVVCDHPSRAAFMRINASEVLKSIRSIYPELDLKKIVTRIRA